MVSRRVTWSRRCGDCSVKARLCRRRGMGQAPELADSDVAALTGNISATLSGSDPSNILSQTRVRKDLMEQQAGFLGISSSGWRVIGILALVAGAILLCALVALAFGLDVGKVVSS